MKPGTAFAHAVVSPTEPVAAGDLVSWTLTVTVGDYGLGVGSELAVVRRSTCDMEIPQFDRPDAGGYTAVETNGDARLEMRFDRKLYRAPWRAGIAVRVTDGMLMPGEQVVIRLGDCRQGSPGMRVQTFPQSRHRLRVLVAHIATGDFRDAEQETEIGIVAGPAVRAQLVVPSQVTVGDAFPVHARVLDAWGNPSSCFEGHLSVVSDRDIDVEPVEPDPETWSQGAAVIARTTINRAGCFYLHAEGALEAESNPVIAVDAGATDRPLFWSDMHWQTDSTVGIGSVEECLSYARDRAMIDVAGWQGNDFQITPDGWNEAREQTARFNENGRFVVFNGYEYSPLSPAGGDHNVYFRGDNSEFFPSCRWQNETLYDADIERPTMRELAEQFRGRDDVMIIPHVGGRACNLDYFDPELMPAIEIFSHHGNFEWLAKDALRRGFVVGFVATSDDHTGRPGLTSPTHLFGGWNTSLDLTGGYTGIYAVALTREAIWEAIRSRHCFATTGARIILDVRMGEWMMGDIVEEASPVLDVAIAGTAPLLEVEVLRGTDVVYRHPTTAPEDNGRYAVYWRGPTAGPRAGKMRWQGSLECTHGRIVDFETFAFTRLGDGVERCSDTTLQIESTTSGNCNGVIIELDVSEESELRFATESSDVRLPLSEVDNDGMPLVMSRANGELRVRKLAGIPGPRTLSFAFADEPPPGMHPYWVRLVQIDGNEAWSSPIYVRKEGH